MFPIPTTLWGWVTLLWQVWWDRKPTGYRAMTRLRCMWCGREVSTDVPANTVVLVSLECPECLQARGEK